MPWFGNDYFDPEKRKWRSSGSVKPRKLFLFFVGIIGLIFLLISMLPIFLNKSDQNLIYGWWSSIWSFGDVLDYVRVIFVIVAVLIFLRGLLGVLICQAKPSSASNWMFWGGISGIVLLLAMWTGILNPSLRLTITTALLGGKVYELNTGLLWSRPPSLLNTHFINTLMFGTKWIDFAIIGNVVWVLGTAPLMNWWRKLS